MFPQFHYYEVTCRRSACFCLRGLRMEGDIVASSILVEPALPSSVAHCEGLGRSK
jgi:hypothetical protein